MLIPEPWAIQAQDFSNNAQPQKKAVLRIFFFLEEFRFSFEETQSEFSFLGVAFLSGSPAVF